MDREGSNFLQTSAGPEVEIDGRRLVFMGGTNYLGMNTHPEVLSVLESALRHWGLSAAGSRTTTGTAAPHVELERRLEALLETDTAVLTPSAYLGNGLLLQTLGEQHDVALVDAQAHSSLREAPLLAGLPRIDFRHRDVDHLRELLAGHRTSHRGEGQRPLILSDAVFAATGVLCPLRAYWRLAREYEATLLIDDAHGFGVLGETGRGMPELEGIPHAEFLYSATFSKAIGVHGGFVAGPKRLGEVIAGTDRYVGATPLPPALALAVAAALELACARGELRAQLGANTRRMKEGLRGMGLEFPETPMPIAAFVAGNARENRRIHRELTESAVLIPHIRYPGGPEEGFFRMVVTAAHTTEQIDRVLETLGSILG